MPIEKEREEIGHFKTRVTRWFRETFSRPSGSVIDRWLRKSMKEKERPISEYKELLDAGALKLLTPEESKQRSDEIKKLIDQGRKKLQSRPPNPT